jgi:magnesium-transporting ATPase (P-type)
MSFFMREILRSSCETCLFSHYYLWNRSLRFIQNRNRIFCEILSKIHRKRSSFMNEECCKQWLMNAKMSRKQNEDKTLNNFRFKRLLLFLVFVQASFAIHSSIFFFQKIVKKKFWSFSSCRLYENLFFFWTSSSSIAFFLIRWKSFSTRRRIQSVVNAVSNFWRWTLLLSAFLMLIDRFAIVVRL